MAKGKCVLKIFEGRLLLRSPFKLFASLFVSLKIGEQVVDIAGINFP